MVEQQVAGHEHALAVERDLVKLGGFLRAEGDGFFNKNVFVSEQEGFGDFEMGVGRGGDGDRRDVGVGEQGGVIWEDRDSGVNAGNVAMIGGGGLDDGSEVAEFVEGADEVFAPIAGSDDSDFHEDG